MTDALAEALAQIDSWKLRGHGDRVSFTAASWRRSPRYAEVSVRRTRGESIEALLWRGVNELNRRLLDGMPRERPELRARRQLRNAQSPSRFAN